VAEFDGACSRNGLGSNFDGPPECVRPGRSERLGSRSVRGRCTPLSGPQSLTLGSFRACISTPTSESGII
jgi:hypothetical protein